MIILLVVQLFLGTMILHILYGVLLNKIQQMTKPDAIENIILVFKILTTLLYLFIAGYYSKCVDLYLVKHDGIAIALILVSLLLAFMLYGPIKYAETPWQKKQIKVSTTIGLMLFILLRVFPETLAFISEWIPVAIWI